MDFNTILQTVIGLIVTPLATELAKKIWNIPALSILFVAIFSVLSAYVLHFAFMPDATLSQLAVMALITAFGGVVLKAADKTRENITGVSLIKTIVRSE